MRDARVVRVARHVAGVLAALLLLLPLALVVAGSLRPVGPLPPVPSLVPARPTLENYELVFGAVDLVRHALNSILVAAVVVPLSVIVAGAAGFSLARMPDPGRRVLLGVSFAATMIPVSMLIVGRFTLFTTAGMTGTYLPLVATALLGGSPFNVLLFYMAFRRMPSELFDAARLDGASTMRVLVSVALPGVPHVVLAVAVLTFAASWGNVLEPLVYLADERMYTLPLTLRSLAALDVPNQPIMLAGAALAVLLPVVVLLVAQQQARRHSGEV